MLCLRPISSLGRNSLSVLIRSVSSQETFAPHEQRTVEIRTCRKTYSALGEDRPYIFRKCPASGIDVRVSYLDTDPRASSSVPTILAVHGAPGNYSDYASTIAKLRAKGFRVVAPNFPGMKFTDQSETFRHTTEEKAELLSDWLDAINVKRIDVAVMHSSAVYPTLKVWDERPGLFRSLVLINPAGHRRIKAMKPEWFVSNLARLNFHPMGRKLFTTVGAKIASAFGVAVKVDGDHADNAVLAATTMFLAGVERLEHLLHKIRQRETRTLYLFSERDKLVDTKIFYEMLYMLGADESMITMCSKEGRVTQEARNQSQEWLRVMDVKDGGHYAFRFYSDLLDEEITKLLTQVYQTDVVSIGNRSASQSPAVEERRSNVYAVNFKRF